MNIRKATLMLLLLQLTTWTGAAAQQNSGTLTLPAYSKHMLNNGMTVLLMEHREVPLVSFQVIVKAGSVADPGGKEGLASATAALLRKGTKTRSSDQISAELDFTGGGFDFAGGVEFTSGSGEFIKKDLGKALELVSDVLINPTFPEDETKKLIAQNIDELRAAKDRAAGVIGRYFSAYLYGTHPYGRPAGGNEISLPTITRQDVVKFFETHYVPANVIFAVAGDFDSAEMRRLIEQRFGSWPAKTAPAVRIEEPKTSTGRRLLLVDKPDSTQTYFLIGNLGVSRTNPDRVAIGVINSLFGGIFSSHLNSALRIDSGLTYGASSSFTQRRQPGPFIISSYTRNAETVKAIDMALQVLRNLHEKGITEKELLSVKTYLKGQYPTNLETADQLAATIAQLEFFGLDASDVNNYYAKVDAVTLDEARRIVKQYFPLENLVFVLIGKASEIQQSVQKYAPKMDTKSITQPGF